jgi:hypothetical protein
MRNGAKVAVIIPALDEEQSIGKVISMIPDWVDEIIVADNGSRDRTIEVARARGARVVSEPQRGYGSACLAGIAALQDPDVVVFLDGDYSDHPEEMARLVDPIVRDEADLVAGSRVLGQCEAGALAPQARFGNWLACALIRLFWKASYTDLGPFRAVRASTLKSLEMRDPDYGWMVEMQIKAPRVGWRVKEVPVSYRRRIGKSKITGTVKGVLGAGAKILLTIFLLAIQPQRASKQTASERLIIFTRYPEPGKTKTRLIPALGPDGAADLHRRMTEHTLKRALTLKSEAVSIEVRFAGGNEQLMRAWLGAQMILRRQGQGDLGACMDRAFRETFQAGAKRVVIIGTDCPALTGALLRTAFEALKQHDIVIGPAHDGGYYLIGLRRRVPQLFQGLPWGTASVLELTLRKAAELGFWPEQLTPLDDVDRPEDLYLWEQEQSADGFTYDAHLRHHPRAQ